MLAIAGKAVTGFVAVSTLAGKAALLATTVVGTAVASFEAGMGAYAIQESMNGRPVNVTEMFRQGLNTSVKGVLAFGTGMMLAATGSYNNLLFKKLPFMQSIKRSLNYFISYGMPRAIISSIIQFPWRQALK